VETRPAQKRPRCISASCLFLLGFLVLRGAAFWPACSMPGSAADCVASTVVDMVLTLPGRTHVSARVRTPLHPRRPQGATRCPARPVACARAKPACQPIFLPHIGRMSVSAPRWLTANALRSSPRMRRCPQLAVAGGWRRSGPPRSAIPLDPSLLPFGLLASKPLASPRTGPIHEPSPLDRSNGRQRQARGHPSQEEGGAGGGGSHLRGTS
jgi:hypothetical protein